MEYLLKVSAIVIIFYFSYKLFLQQTTFFEKNRWFLLIGLITAFSIPFFVIPNYIEYTPAIIPEFVSGNFSTETIAITPKDIEQPFHILDYLPIFYGLGVLFFSVKFIIQFVSLSLVILKNKHEKNGLFTFIKTTKNNSPFSFFNWIVFNPNNFTETELEQVIIHEKVHASQQHSIDVLLTQISCIVLWFNPFIWMYNKSVKQNLEFIADQKTQEKFNCKKSYQTTLLKASLPNHHLTLSNNFYNSLIKKRIVMLNKSKSKKINLIKFAFVIPLLALFLMSFNRENVYVEKENNIEEFLIYNNFSDSDFKELKKSLKVKGFDFDLKKIERRNLNLISTIHFDVSKNDITNSYSVARIKPINTIVIQYYKNEKKIIINTLDFIKSEIKNIDDKDLIEIIIDKDRTVDYLERKKKFLKENHNIDFIYEIESKKSEDHIPMFSYKFATGATSVGTSASTQEKMVLKYNLKTKLLTTYSLNANGDPEYGRIESLNTRKSYAILNYYKDKDLENATNKLKNNGVLVKFTNIKRNDKGEILAIDVNAKFENGGETNYSVNTENPIKPFSISYNENGSNLMIGAVFIPIEETETTTKNKLEEFIIYNHFSYEKMQDFKEKLKEKGFKFQLKEIERNTNNQITSISFEIEKNGAKGEYGILTGEPLKTVVIKYSEAKNKFSIKTLDFINNEKLIDKSKNVVEIVIQGNKNTEALEKQKIELKEKYNIDFTFEIVKESAENEYVSFAFNNGVKGIGPVSGVGFKEKAVVKYDTKTKLFTAHIIKENGDFGVGISMLLESPKGYSIRNYYDDVDFKSVEKYFKKYNVNVKFTNIKRNDKDEIIAIHISAKNENGKITNFNIDDKEPIKDISINYFENSKTIKIGQGIMAY